MFNSKTSLQIKKPDGQYVDLGPYLVEVNYDYPLLFAEGSGRNLAGSMVADFIGIFPKIKCQIGPLNKTQYETLAPIINSPMQIVKYYDADKQQVLEIETYPNGHNVTDKCVITEETAREGFDVTFIARKKRP